MKKKVTKKVVKKVKKPVSRETRVVVEVKQSQLPSIVPSSELIEPIRDGKKMALTPTWVTSAQLIRLVQRTPSEQTYTRPGKGGQTWTYVTGNYVEKVLNFVFGWNWDFEVVAHGREGDQIWVHGKLTVKSPKGDQSISKSQFGRADVKFKKDTKIMLDFGNDMKAATTDALKKCASLLGIASDIYGKQEFRQEANVIIKEPVVSVATVKAIVDASESQEVEDHEKIIGPNNKPTFVCGVCKDPISDTTAEYSKKIYGKRLCREHQSNAKRK